MGRDNEIAGSKEQIVNSENGYEITDELKSGTRNENLQLNEKYSFHSIFDIIKAAENGQLPNQIMMTFHPQR